MKKVFGLLMLTAALLVFRMPQAEAGYVQIFDRNVMTLAGKMSGLLIALKDDTCRMSVPENMGRFRPDSPYINYIASVGPKGSAVVVVFYCNEDGSVSKANLMFDPKNSAAVRCAKKAGAAMLFAMGLERDYITQLMLMRVDTDSVWSEMLDRRIIVDFILQREMVNMRILAADE